MVLLKTRIEVQESVDRAKGMQDVQRIRAVSCVVLSVVGVKD